MVRSCLTVCTARSLHACKIAATTSSMVQLIALCKVSKFLGGELWTIVAQEGLRHAMPGKH